MMRSRFILMLACAAWSGVAFAQTTLVMRGAVKPPPGDVTAVGVQGVTVSHSPPAVPASPGKPPPKAPAPTVMVVSWDRVESVQGDLAENAAEFLPGAEKAWRARSRLDRGDLVAAEPLFEELFANYGTLRGPTSAVVDGGLLRCRLGTGAQTAAVGPWLAYLNALGDNDSAALAAPEADPGSGPAVDGATGLCPSLPPVWVNLPSVQSLARSPWPLSKTEADVRQRVAILSAVYEQAARFEAGLSVTTFELPAEHDEGMSLVRDIVIARIGDQSQRQAARQALANRLKKRPAPWLEAWVHVGIGRSLLLEQSRDSQLLGVAELSELPARMERVSPYLTGIAIAESSVALMKLGDLPGATRLRNDLSDRFPGHPAMEWEALRSWAGAAPVPVPTNPTTPTPTPAPPAPSNGAADQPKGGPA